MPNSFKNKRGAYAKMNNIKNTNIKNNILKNTELIHTYTDKFLRHQSNIFSIFSTTIKQTSNPAKQTPKLRGLLI
jgi:hypothetical protein